MAAIMLVSRLSVTRSELGELGVICSRINNYSTDVTESSVRKLKTTNLSSLKRGTGGRSSFNGMVATVFGNTGFMGRYVCNKLGKIGTQMILPYRCDQYDTGRLKCTGDLGQVLFQQFDLNDEESIRKSIKHSNVVINLIGRDWETKNFNFEEVHVDGARRLARICREMGVERLIHVSSLNLSQNPEAILLKGGSKFLKSKYLGELAVKKEFPDVTIIRPSDVYGQEDRFLRLYASNWRHQLRGVPLWKNGEKTVKQPVFVSDVAQAIVNAAKDPDTAGKTYQAIGPKRYLLSELVDWFHRVMRKDNNLWGYYRYDMRWDPSFMMKASITEQVCWGFPVGNVHPERVEREFISDVVQSDIPTLEDLGVQLTTMEEQVPWELRPYRALQYYDEALNEFEKPAPPKSLD